MDYSHLRHTAVYQAATLQGNWAEERDLRRTVLQDVISRKCTATLRLDAYSQRLAAGLQEVELTRIADDGYVHFGDVIQLVHLETACVLASDQGDGTEQTCAATGAPEVRSPCARNAFTLLPYAAPCHAVAERDYGDATLRYGCKVKLGVHPSYFYGGSSSGGSTMGGSGSGNSSWGASSEQAPLCLFSRPISMQHSSKYTRNQLVGFTRRDTFDTVWEVLTPDPSQRTLSMGLEVMAGAPVLLMHCATQKPLVLENQKYPNDFGMEKEVTARVSCGKGLKLSLEQTRVGIMKGSTPQLDSSDAYWAFMTGDKVEAAADPMPTQRTQAGLDAVAGVARELLALHGSILTLERKLVTWSSRAQELPADEVLLLLRQVGLSTPVEEAEAIVRQFAVAQKPSAVDAGELLAALRSAAGEA